MKRAGFTMIELIFVIVILGILSAVALPKFIGVSDQARVGKLQGYVGTLNRTVLPPYWSESLLAGDDGKISNYETNIKADLEVPDNVPVAFATANLVDPTYSFAAVSLPSKTVGSQKYNGVTYTIVCADGNATNSARCDLFNGKSNKYMLHNNQ
jgi:prepilin-type N-terminal cleavage/methylation domain-containing protein